MPKNHHPPGSCLAMSCSDLHSTSYGWSNQRDRGGSPLTSQLFGLIVDRFADHMRRARETCH
jgi:hypothetical protein